MDKVATLKSVLSTTEVKNLHHDIGTRIEFIPFGGVAEPVLIFEQSELVGWLRMEGETAVWRYGSMRTGRSSAALPVGNPLAEDGRHVANEVNHAWDVIKPEWPPTGGDPGEPEHFAAAIEAGDRPASWSQAAATPQYVYRPVPAAPAPQSPARATAAAAAESPYETEFSPYRHDRTRYPAAPGYSEQQLDGRILETVHPATAPAIIGGVALFLAVIPMPYEFYVLLRWAVPAMAVWTCTLASSHKRSGWVAVFAMIAVTWNPVFPIEMPRGFWTFPDLIGAGLFATAGVSLRASKPALRLNHPSSL